MHQNIVNHYSPGVPGKTFDKPYLGFVSYFFKARFGTNLIINHHHKTICEALEKVYSGQITRLIINIAPRYSKTEFAVKNFIAYGLALNPGARFIHLTYAAKLALDNSEDAKELVQSEEYQRMFPNVAIKKNSRAKDKWYTTENGGVYAAAAGGQVTGFGAGRMDADEEEITEEEPTDARGDNAKINERSVNEFANAIVKYTNTGLFGGAIIIDDPIKPDDAQSALKLNRINERFETTIRSRVNSRKTPIIVIQQRVHENDLSGYLMRKEPGVWTVLCLPCLQADNTALWPVKHTVEELLHLRQINGYVFEAQYQQNPQPLKRGGEFYKLFNQSRNTVENKISKGLPKLYNPLLPLHLSFDFNVNPYITCTVWQLKGKAATQIDELCLPNPNNRTTDICKTLKARYGKHTAGMFIYGDPCGIQQDTRTEAGQNDYTIILAHLAQFHPTLRVQRSAPSVVMRGNFINSVFSAGYMGITIAIGRNCQHSIADYMFLKEAADGTKLKEKTKDIVTQITSEKYGHTSDSSDYFICTAFAGEYASFQRGGKTFALTTGKPMASANAY